MIFWKKQYKVKTKRLYSQEFNFVRCFLQYTFPKPADFILNFVKISILTKNKYLKECLLLRK